MFYLMVQEENSGLSSSPKWQTAQEMITTVDEFIRQENEAEQ